MDFVSFKMVYAVNFVAQTSVFPVSFFVLRNPFTSDAFFLYSPRCGMPRIKIFGARRDNSSANFEISLAMSCSETEDGTLRSYASLPPMKSTIRLYLPISDKKSITLPIRAPGRDKMLKFGKIRFLT